MSYKLGLTSVSFRDSSPEEILKEMKKCGLKYIEWGCDIHAPTKNAKQISELTKKYGIICSSYGTYFRLGETALTELSEYIFAAKELETNILRIWCGNKAPEQYSDDELTELISISKEASLIAEKNNVILCLECHRGTLTYNADSALSLMKTVNSKHFRMYWQPQQFMTDVQNLHYAEVIAPYTENIHVFNWKKEERFPLESATDVWKQYLSKFKNDKVLLLEFMPDDNIESLKREADALRKIAGE